MNVNCNDALCRLNCDIVIEILLGLCIGQESQLSKAEGWTASSKATEKVQARFLLSLNPVFTGRQHSLLRRALY